MTHEPILGFQGQYRFLSNFWVDDPIFFRGLYFKSAEHIYQSLKTADYEEMLTIQACATPGDAKRAGKNLTIQENWEDIKYEAMRETVGAKFIGNGRLAYHLVHTEDAFLEETNTWHDNYWGCCSCPDCGVTGQNKLGKILMELRRDLAIWI